MDYVVLCLAIVITLGVFSFWRRSRQRACICDYAFPSGLRKKFDEVHSGLTAAQQDQVFERLRQWFMVCSHAGRQFVSMPSQVIDDAWHAFILFTRNYQRYCRKAFGRFLHHTPAEAMTDQTAATDGIRRAWRIACKLEEIDPKNPATLPALFAMDAALGIAGGFHYELQCINPVATPTVPAALAAQAAAGAAAAVTAAVAAAAVETDARFQSGVTL